MKRFFTLLISILLIIQVQFSIADEFIGFNDEQLRVLQRKIASSFPTGKLLNDPIIDYYINNINERLEASERTYVSVNDQKSVNAFAIWGNSIVVHSGMFTFSRNEHELAGVIAHEHAHITQHHLVRLSEQTGLFSQLSAISLLVALFSKSEDAINIFAGVTSIEKSVQYGVMRKLEREADQLAIVNITRSGYDATQFAEVLKRLSGLSGGTPEYLATHPISENRVAEFTSYARNRSKSASNKKLELNDLDFLLSQQRIVFFTSSKINFAISAEHQDIINAYAKHLSRSLSTQDAIDAFTPYAKNWIIAYELGDLYLANDDYDNAVAVLQNAIAEDPNNIPIIAKLLEVYAKSKNEKDAKKLLNNLNEETRLEPAIVNAETRMWFEFDNEFNYRIAVGYQRYVNGDFGAAKTLVRQIKTLDEANEISSAAGRLALLETKIEELEELTQ